jgi:hypothetical protein
VTSYATLEELRVVAAAYQVVVGSDDEAQRALDLAARDLDLFLIGVGTLDTTQLTDDQADAVSDATCIQACFRIQQTPDLMLGLDDGISSVGPLSFSPRTPARLSPEAEDRVTGLGLLKRSGCAPPPPEG